MSKQKQNYNKVTVQIYGELYNIKGDQDPERIRQVARKVHEQMRQIAAANPTLAAGRVAVLAALNIAEEYIHLDEDYRQLIAMLQEEKQ